jgi:hypothetical protein
VSVNIAHLVAGFYHTSHGLHFFLTDFSASFFFSLSDMSVSRSFVPQILGGHSQATGAANFLHDRHTMHQSCV